MGHPLKACLKRGLVAPLLLSLAVVASPPPYNSSEIDIMLGVFRSQVDVNGLGYTIASPSKSEPDYYYHWVRDASISIRALKAWVPDTEWDTHMEHFNTWMRHTQNQTDPNGIDILGEPKYFVPSGNVYNKPWGRPQRDGPALRAIANMIYGLELWKEGRTAYVHEHLWTPNCLPETGRFCGTIKADLEYVAHHWEDSSFDLWEECNGHHFFTLVVQRNALLRGAELGVMVGDPGAATFYAKQASATEAPLRSHYNHQTRVIMETLPPHGGPYKYNNLDVGVLLGVLYGDKKTPVFGISSSELASTVAALYSVFNDGSFPINQQDTRNGIPGLLFGRYPNDTYDGTGQGKGNPWILCTNAVGQYHYELASAVCSGDLKEGSQEFVKVVEALRPLLPAPLPETRKVTAKEFHAALIKAGDGYLLRVKYHIAGLNYHMPEELNLNTGYSQGARDLTWSYGTVLDALGSRQGAVECQF